MVSARFPAAWRGRAGPSIRSRTRADATPGQVALAWVLRRSPVMLPIPGTSQLSHLEENFAAAQLELNDQEFASLNAAAPAGAA